MERGTFFSFVPHRLEIIWKPELYHFPFDVLFISYSVKDGRQVIGNAVYEPEFHAFGKDGHLSLMRYHNIYGGESYLLIAYDEKNKQYHGEKFVSGRSVDSADGGDDWNQFFVHLIMLGLIDGEQCKFEDT